MSQKNSINLSDNSVKDEFKFNKLINGIHRNCDLDQSQKTYPQKIHCRNFFKYREVEEAQRTPKEQY